MRNIDKHINLYTCVVECYTDNLRRCLPSEESEYLKLRDSAQTVLDALVAHRAIFDERTKTLNRYTDGFGTI